MLFLRWKFFNVRKYLFFISFFFFSLAFLSMNTSGSSTSINCQKS